MISHDEAIALFESLGTIKSSEVVSFDNALGRALLNDFKAPVSLPLFDNSAMDGVALRKSQHEKSFTLQGSRLAKKVEDPWDDPSSLSEGEAFRIMTGSAVPKWVDLVVPVEYLKESDELFFVEDYPLEKGSNIRRAGEDFTEGDIVFAAGTVLNSEKLTVLANFGVTEVEVIEDPIFVLATTGDEVRPPGTTLSAGEIFNSSCTFVHSQMQAHNKKVDHYSHLTDDFEECRQFIEQWLSHSGPSLLMTTGAVSMGEKDALPQVAKELGLTIHFHKSSVRPGKPVLFATNKERNKRWIGAPGNALSTVSCWTYFVKPLMHYWAGWEKSLQLEIPLAEDIKKPKHLKSFILGQAKDGKVSPNLQKGSQRVKGLGEANVFLEIPQGLSSLQAGSLVRCTFL